VTKVKKRLITNRVGKLNFKIVKVRKLKIVMK